jgi:hypothetical protein
VNCSFLLLLCTNYLNIFRFQAKQKRGEIPKNLLDSPQPCSSRQALERDRLRREARERQESANSVSVACPDGFGTFEEDNMFTNVENNATPDRQNSSAKQKNASRRLNFD